VPRRPRSAKRMRTPLGDLFPLRLMADPWWTLTPEELAEAVAVAKREGAKSITSLFEGVDGEEPGSVPLSRTLIAQNQEFRGLSEEAIRTRIRIKAIPTLEEYLDWFFESSPAISRRFRAAMDPDDAALDPRVAHFCTSSHQTLCRLLDLPQPPTGTEELEKLVQEAEEDCRRSAPTWNAAAAQSTESMDIGDAEEMRRYAMEASPHDPMNSLPFAILRRDLAEMMFYAALYDRSPERWLQDGQEPREPALERHLGPPGEARPTPAKQVQGPVASSQRPGPSWEPTIGLRGADFIDEVRRRAEEWWQSLDSAERPDAGMRVIRVIEARYGLRGLERLASEVPYQSYLVALDQNVAFHSSMRRAGVTWADLCLEMGYVVARHQNEAPHPQDTQADDRR
jgi:hypothetical protein